MGKIELVVKGHNVKVTKALREYVSEKIGRLPKYFEQVRKGTVELLFEDHKSAEKSQKVKITLYANGTLFRCEEASISMYASIDIAAEKLERQLKRYKEKLFSKDRGRMKEGAELDEGPAVRTVEGREPEIVKVKRFPIKPMAPEEAVLQMDMLNHDFFVFLNSDSEQVSVLYRRSDGNFGLIEPDRI